jgi:hypothetical protein
MNNQTNLAESLVGAWELVSGSYVGDDQGAIDYEQAGIQSLKVLSANKFSFISTVQGAFYAAGGGDYFAENGTYTEVPVLASFPDMLGKRFEFQFTLDGDTWENSRWQNGVRIEHEVWKRVH